MQTIPKASERSVQVADPPLLDRTPAQPPATTGAEYQGPVEMSRGAAPRHQDKCLTAEQEQLMIEHLPIVRFVALRIHERLPQHVPFEDLYSAGVVGLMDALGKFDRSKHIKFRGYAQFRIRDAILDTLRSLDWSSRGLRRNGRATEQAIQTLTAELGRAPSDLEIGNELRVDLESYQQLLAELKNLEIGTLHAKRWEDSGEEELVCLPNRPEDDPLFRYLHVEMRERLTEAIEHLPERERLVLTLYYYEEMTMKEIGIILGVQQARVSQIHASAVLHLRARLTDPAQRESQRTTPGLYRQRTTSQRGRVVSPGASVHFSGRP
jgi:RNA polymerase sigma factor for flagellar operon FliA